MNTTLNEDEAMIRESARRFLEAECSTKLVRGIEQDTKGYSPDLWRKAAEMGWQGIALPEEHGGSGLGLVSFGLVMEEIGRALAPLPMLPTVVTALALVSDASPQIRDVVVPRVATGDAILTFAFHECDPRLDPGAVAMTAVADGADFVLNGVKLFVENFGVADHCLVVCRTSPASADGAGISLFLVDTTSAGLAHLPLTTLAKDRVSEVRFADVRVPAANMVGDLHQGWPIFERLFDRATALLCTQMLGAARKDSEMAVEWAKYRKAFGQPIGAFQSLQHMCADALIWIDGGGLLAYEALWRMDQGLPARVETSQAKAFCNEKCLAAVRISQVIHGGMGFMMEFDLQLWYRRVAAWTTRLGTVYEHRARIAAALLDEPGQVILGRPVPVVAEVA